MGDNDIAMHKDNTKGIHIRLTNMKMKYGLDQRAPTEDVGREVGS